MTSLYKRNTTCGKKGGIVHSLELLGLLRAFGSCFHPCGRHHSGLEGFYVFCSQRKCTLCLKWGEGQRHHGRKLCQKRVWIIDVGVNFCGELKKSCCVVLRCVSQVCATGFLFFCVCGVVDFLVARVLVCVYIKITWCHYCTMLCLDLRFLPERRQ